MKLGREGEDERTVVLGKVLKRGLGKFIREDGCSPAWSRGPVRMEGCGMNTYPDGDAGMVELTTHDARIVHVGGCSKKRHHEVSYAQPYVFCDAPQSLVITRTASAGRPAKAPVRGRQRTDLGRGQMVLQWGWE